MELSPVASCSYRTSASLSGRRLSSVLRPQQAAFPNRSGQHHLQSGQLIDGRPGLLQPSKRQAVRARVFNNGSGGKEDFGDRVVATIPYLLPLLDALPFGKFIFLQYPFVARAMSPLGPVAALYNTIPFAPFIAFLLVYNGIVGNNNLSRFVRFNAMQAVLLDILLIIPQVLLTTIFRNPGDSDLSFQAFITTNNTVFLFVAISVAYGMGASLVGQEARLPLVGEAAETQVNRRGF